MTAETLEEPILGPKNLNHWVDFIAEKEMPVFSQTATQLAQMVANNKSSSAVQKKGAEMNLLFEMIAEGIHRGIGMDRTIFSTLTPDLTLKSRIIHAHEASKTPEHLDIPLKQQSRNYFHHAFETRMAIYYPANPPAELAVLKTPLILGLFGDAPCFFMPVCINNKPIGLFTSDRKTSGRSLSNNDFANFKKFVMQGTLYLSQLKRMKKK